MINKYNITSYTPKGSKLTGPTMQILNAWYRLRLNIRRPHFSNFSVRYHPFFLRKLLFQRNFLGYKVLYSRKVAQFIYNKVYKRKFKFTDPERSKNVFFRDRYLKSNYIFFSEYNKLLYQRQSFLNFTSPNPTNLKLHPFLNTRYFNKKNRFTKGNFFFSPFSRDVAIWSYSTFLQFLKTYVFHEKFGIRAQPVVCRDSSFSFFDVKRWFLLIKKKQFNNFTHRQSLGIYPSWFKRKIWFKRQLARFPYKKKKIIKKQSSNKSTKFYSLKSAANSIVPVQGQLVLRRSRRNFFFTVLGKNNQVVAKNSCGMDGFLGRRRRTPHAVSKSISSIIKKIQILNLNRLVLRISTLPRAHHEEVISVLRTIRKPKIVYITENIPLPHGSPKRLPRSRFVLQNYFVILKDFILEK